MAEATKDSDVDQSIINPRSDVEPFAPGTIPRKKSSSEDIALKIDALVDEARPQLMFTDFDFLFMTDKQVSEFIQVPLSVAKDLMEKGIVPTITSSGVKLVPVYELLVVLKRCMKAGTIEEYFGRPVEEFEEMIAPKALSAIEKHIPYHFRPFVPSIDATQVEIVELKEYRMIAWRPFMSINTRLDKKTVKALQTELENIAIIKIKTKTPLIVEKIMDSLVIQVTWLSDLIKAGKDDDGNPITMAQRERAIRMMAETMKLIREGMGSAGGRSDTASKKDIVSDTAAKRVRMLLKNVKGVLGEAIDSDLDLEISISNDDGEVIAADSRVVEE